MVDIITIGNDTADKIGNYFADNYKSELNSFLSSFSFSPIEQLFYVAFKGLFTLCPVQSKNLMSILPQVQIDKYRVDYLVSFQGKNIVVELDGHEFHDRDEKQRRYEKQRDRFLIEKGYIIQHFTGKEVTDDPFRVAGECLSLALGLPKDFFSYGF